MKQHFNCDWLSLRELADAAARSTELRRRVMDWAERHDVMRGDARRSDVRRIVDLGAGTGSGLRWLAPALSMAQDWWLIDHDPELLARWSIADNWPATVAVHIRQLDLARELERLAELSADLVTASALLDLVSAEWLDRLAAHCRRVGAALYCTLNVDGTRTWTPELAVDQRVNERFNQHQRGDKGFGPALGAAAVEHLATRLRALGYRVEIAASPWRLGPNQGELQQALLDGYRSVVEELEPDASWLAHWYAERRSLIARPEAEHRVGHRDLFAWLPETG